MKTFRLNDQNMGPAAALRHRQVLIELRNAALDQMAFDYAVVLSEIIGMHCGMAEEIWGEEWKKRL